jgi:signal transduction histidine kinase/CHASE3 domain sensor protein/CheY-like chemotaxis protein
LPNRLLIQQIRTNLSRTRWFAGLATVLLVLLGSISAWQLTRLHAAAQAVSASQEVARETADFLEVLVETESGHRGFVLTGQQTYLSDYEAARQAALQKLGTYMKTLHTVWDQGAAGRLEVLLRAKLAEMDEVVQLYRRGESVEAQQAVARNHGRFLMEAIEDAVIPLKQRSSQQLREDQRELEVRASVGVLTIFGVTGFVLLLALSLFRVQTTAHRRLVLAVQIIQRQEGYLAATLSSIDAPVLLLDTDLRAQFANPAALSLIGLSLEEVLTRPLNEFLKIYEPNSGGTPRFMKAVQDRKILREPRLAVETRLGRHLMKIAVYPVSSSEGRPLGNMIELQGLDHEERLALELHARDTVQGLEAELGRIVSTNESDAILRQGAESIVRIVNATKVRIWLGTGHSESGSPPNTSSPLELFCEANQEIGVEGSDTTLPAFDSNASMDAPDLVVDAWAQGQNLQDAGEQTGTVQLAYPLVTGTDHLGVLEAIFPRHIHELIRDELPRCALQLGLAYERSKNAEEIEKLALEKDAFVATLSHELRGPLAPIRYALDELITQTPNDDRRTYLHSILDRQAKHLLRMVDDLLDMQRLNRGTLQIRPTMVKFEEVLSQSVEAILPFVRKKRQELLLDDQTDGAFLLADGARLVQVLYNLLHNASRYSGPGKRIWLGASAGPEALTISVRDEGIGISDTNRSRVFEMFERGTMVASEEGLGIGLALVRHLLQLHGGEVKAESPGSGGGSTFKITLPRLSPLLGSYPSRPPSDPTPAALGRPTEMQPLAGEKCLIVDDDVDAAEGLSELVRGEGLTPFVAHDIEGATDIASRERPRVVLLDLSLPGLGRFDLLNILRPLLGADARFLAVTGFSDEQTKTESLAGGFEGFITKPVSIAALRVILRQRR